MAKELRLQMMDLWTFRESTSPESVTSEQDDGRPFTKVPSFEEKTEARRKLFKEAQEVFNSIASLQRSSQDTSSPTSPHAPSSPVPSPLSLMDPPQIHSPRRSPQSDMNMRHTFFLDTLSDHPSKAPPSLSPPSLSKSRRTHLLKGSSSLRPSLTSPSLPLHGGGKNTLLPQREAWSLDLEDDPSAKDERLSHWVNGAPLPGARGLEKTGSIEEEEDDSVFESERTEASQSPQRRVSYCVADDERIPDNHFNEINPPEILLDDDDPCKFFLEYESCHSQPAYESRNHDRKKVMRERPGDLEKLEIVEANDEDVPDNSTSSHNLPELDELLPTHNLPELDELLPKGPNTTFADLIRVHDQLHKFEMEKQTGHAELATKRKRSDSKRELVKPPQRDHLQEAFQTCQKEDSSRQEELHKNQSPQQPQQQEPHQQPQEPHHQQQPQEPHHQPCYKYDYLSEYQPEIFVPSPTENLPADQYQTDYENYQISLRDARILEHAESLHRPEDPGYDPSKLHESRDAESSPTATQLAHNRHGDTHGRSNVTTSLQIPRKREKLPNGNQEVDLTSMAAPTKCLHDQHGPAATSSTLDQTLHLPDYPDPDSMERMSQFGTWKTSASSRSFDHVLSSSFEWEQDEHPGFEPHRSPASLASAQRINLTKGHDQVLRKKSEKTEPCEVSSPETADLPEERSQFETEVTPEHIQTSLGRLRTRRVSDTQVEYHESSGRKVHRKASARIPTNVFVPTKRTIFTPTSNAHATPNFLQSVGEDTISQAEVGKTSKPITVSEDRSKLPREILQLQQENRDYADSKILSSSAELLENGGGGDSRLYWRGASMPGITPLVGAVSPPVESKRKVLEAANRASGETSPTVRGMIELYNKRITETQSLLTSPFKYWMSDSASSSPNNTRKISAPLHLHIPSPVSVMKSSSATVVPASAVSPDLLQGIQKSASGPTWNSAARASPMLNTPLDTSLDTSVDEVQLPGARSFKIKKAKEEFFSRANPARRESKKRYSNESANTASYDSLNISMTTTPSPQPVIVVSPDADMNEKPPIQGQRRHSGTHRKDSVRRESAGAVMKSASSGVVQYRQPHPIRPSSTEPVLHSGRCQKGIFRLFRRSKEKDRKDLTAVQKLCRHSLEVDIEKIEGGKEEKRPSTSSLNVVGVSSGRSSSTLPRPNDGAGEGPSTRSCPSSPVAQPRTRASSWLARGKELLKGRSPSPNILKQTPR